MINTDFNKIFSTESFCWSTPAVSESLNLICLADRMGFLYLFDLSKNKLLWKIKLDTEFTSSPVFCDLEDKTRILICGDKSGIIYKINIDGEIAWQKNIGIGIRSTPLVKFCDVHNKIVIYISSYGNFLCKLNFDDGDVIWKSFIGNHPYNSIFSYKKQGAYGAVSSPLVYDVDNDGIDEIFIGTRNKMLLCIKADSGKICWFKRILADPDSSPSIAFFKEKKYLYIGGGEHTNGLGDRKFYCLDPTNGKEIWTYQTMSGLDSCPIVREKDGNLKVYVTSLAESTTFCFNGVSGDLIWKAPFGLQKHCQHDQHNVCFTKEKYFTEDAVCRSYTTPLYLSNENGTYIVNGNNNGILQIVKEGYGKKEIDFNKPIRSSPILYNFNNNSHCVIIAGNDVFLNILEDFNYTSYNQFNLLLNSFLKVDNVTKTFKIRPTILIKLSFYFYIFIIDFFRYCLNFIDSRFKTSILIINKKNIKRS